MKQLTMQEMKIIKKNSNLQQKIFLTINMVKTVESIGKELHQCAKKNKCLSSLVAKRQNIKATNHLGCIQSW